MKAKKNTAKTFLRLISAIILIACTVTFALVQNSELLAISLILFLAFGVFLIGISFNN